MSLSIYRQGYWKFKNYIFFGGEVGVILFLFRKYYTFSSKISKRSGQFQKIFEETQAIS